MERKKYGSRNMFILWMGVIGGILLILTAGAVITENFVYTPPFKGPDGKVLPNSIAEFRRVTVGRDSQAVLIRGKSLDNPVVLFLSAGPGLSEMGLMRNFNPQLEDHYTMAYMDMRGSGKSYTPFLNLNKTYTTEQLLEDIHEMTLYLKKKLGKEKIVILGHCFGAGFGTLAAVKYPGDYSACVCIEEPVNPTEISRLSYPWALDQAKKEDNKKAVRELESVNGYWLAKSAEKYFPGMMIHKKWIGYYGGQIIGEKGFVSYVLSRLPCHEFTFFDFLPYLAGMMASGPVSFDIMVSTDFKKQAPELKVPMLFLTGRQDYNVVPSLVEEYYNMVKAPVKKIFWFEKSAHFPHMEEKELFQKTMIEDILPIVRP